MKVKIGTQLEEEIFQTLKVEAARERKPISELIQVAVVTYLHQQSQPQAVKSGLRRFLEQPHLNVSDEAFHEILNSDDYAQ